AYRYVPYYRETMDRLGLRPSDFRAADDLARLPILEREQLQRDPEYFCSTAQPRDRYLALRSGGSCGAPRTVYHDARAIFQNAAHGERERCIYTALLERSFGYGEAVIASPLSTSQEVQRFTQEHAVLPGGLRIRRCYLSLLDPPEKNLALLNEFRPDVINSYGSYLQMLFSYLADSGAAFHRPRLLVYSSDGLEPSARRLIQERFGIPVFSTYQAIEAFKIAFECEEHAGLHLNADLYPMRIVDGDGRPLPAGETGETVISNLVNRGTVLLNYRLGDLTSFLPGRCPCGRTLPLISFIEGRSDDLVELPSGQVLHPQAVRTIFTEERQVWQYQVIQHGRTEISVAVVAAKECDRLQLRTRLIDGFARRFGDQVKVTVSFVDSLERTPGGKLRVVIRSPRSGERRA
ncbi:MAG: hypothetical protein QME94_14105, partial [Anaerolineae bacterium]|nr:hypothetical protein [Anaerolineae bacterium]